MESIVNYKSIIFMGGGMIIQRILNKLDREITAKNRAVRRKFAKDDMDGLSQREKEIVNALLVHGGCMSSLQELGLEEQFNKVKNGKTFELTKSIKEGLDKKPYAKILDSEYLSEVPELYRFGLNETFLRIAKAYLKLSTMYRSVVPRIDFPNGKLMETRLFHIDADDDRMVKFIVYLTDVEEEDGPFQFVPITQATEATPVKQNGKARVWPEEMAKVAPEKDWITCCGKAGTIVIGDTCHMYHRGVPGTRNERHAIFYSYCSKNPHAPKPQAVKDYERSIQGELATLSDFQKSFL